MRTEVERIPVILTVPTTVDYQFDDTFDEDNPHVYHWQGKTVSGPSKRKAKEALGMLIGGAIWDKSLLENVL